MPDTSRDLSLLWPPRLDRPAPRQTPRLTASAARDLDLERTVAALSADYGYAPRIRDILLQLADDPDVIRYRQDALTDLVEMPALFDPLEAILPTVHALDSFPFGGHPDQSELREVVWRIGQLEAYVEVVKGLRAAFEGLPREPRSEAWRALRDLTARIEQEETFQRLAAELPEMLDKVRSIASVTIGVNLDDHLRPVEATLLAINNRKFRGFSPSLFTTLFGREGDAVEWEGIASLHTARPTGAARFQGIEVENPMLYPLFRDLAQVLKRVSRPIASALHHYARVNTRFLNDLGAELAFYLGAARLIGRIRASGLPMTRPEIAPHEDRVCEIEGAYNLNLALRFLDRARDGRLNGAVVLNDVTFGPEGRVFVLTGPNQGGKTTYTQAVGLAQVLAQAGLYVPGQRARLSPADGVFTHFPVEERPEMEAGRLGEEAGRLSDIFARATRHSLILLNESLASTSPGESLYLARDVLRILRLLGARAIFATHLHDLAAGCEEINAETPGDSAIISLVSVAEEDGAGEIRQTFRIAHGPPRGRSYAREIASRYGISYEQLERLLRERGVMDERDS
jgi:hypothetical protein